VIGGPNDSICPWAGAEQNAVRASYNHPYIAQAISQVVGGSVLTGDDTHVNNCGDYRDSGGHLVDTATGPMGQSIASFYQGTSPPPTATPQPVPTNTPLPPTATRTSVPTSTPVPTNTPLPPSPSPTRTPAPSATAAPT